MINTVTLNPAVDKLLFVDEFVRGITNRIKRTEVTMGGKGTHVSMNLSVMGMRSRAFGLTYGKTGWYIMQTLQKWDIDTHFAHRNNAESRTNYLLVEGDGTGTLITEKGIMATEEDVAALVEQLHSRIGQGEYLVLSGDVSNYPDPCIYNRLIRSLADKSLKVFMDASGATLARSLTERLFLIKPNEDELAALCGHPVHTQELVVQAIRELDARYAIEVIAVSLGARGSVVRMPDGIFKASPPPVHVQNTVGCGDCFMAGLLYGFYQAYSSADILRLATAVSSAAAESQMSVGFDKSRADALYELVQVERIG